MALEILNVGAGNFVAVARVVGVVRADSSPVRRLMETAEKAGRLVDATGGRRTRTVIVTDSNHVVLSNLSPQTLGERLSAPTPTVARAEESEADVTL
jgi:regulator of extracellular matrix RemA (YlzA/DUF370 family)